MSHSTLRGPATTEFCNRLEAFTLEALHRRHFVLTITLQQWLRSTVPNTTYSQIEGLLQEAYHDRREIKPSLPVTSESVSRDSLLVFSILLEIGYGHLIDRFRDHSFVDRNLPIHDAKLRSWLQTEEIADFDKADRDTVANLFDKAQWKFCAPHFHLDDAFTYPHQRILPIHRRKRINDKGGTAQLWEIEVPEEFVGESLKPQVENSCYNSLGQYGKVSASLKSSQDIGRLADEEL